jgi:hypothetical protein
VRIRQEVGNHAFGSQSNLMRGGLHANVKTLTIGSKRVMPG